jgi:hypothetical protein
MPNDEHVALLKRGVAAWNAWRKKNRDIHPNLSGANLSGARLEHADLREADLSGANLSGADLFQADFSKANLSGSNLNAAGLFQAGFSEADLSGANLSAADLYQANLSKANLSGARLITALLLDTDLTDADLTGCYVYGVSAWSPKLKGAKQFNLIITSRTETKENEPTITVDNIEVAQFIYLMSNNQKIRHMIDTITSKAVLILGRFTDERKAVLDALREELRKRDYVPILFDFDKPINQTTEETITLLARMSRFVIADISAKSVVQELHAIVPNVPSVPVQPIILATQEEPGMFDFYRNFRSFLPVHHYASQEQLLADLGEKVIRPAELKVLELRGST